MSVDLASASSEALEYPTAIVSTPFSFAAWVKLANDTASQDVMTIATAGDASNDYHRLFFDNSFSDRLRYRTNRTGSNGTATSASSLVAGTWYHVGCVEISANSRRVFLDGAFADNATSLAPTGMDTTWLGGFPDTAQSTAGANHFDGSMACACWWDVDIRTVSNHPFTQMAAGASPLLFQPSNITKFMPLVDSTHRDIVGQTTANVIGTPTLSGNPPGIGVFPISDALRGMPAAVSASIMSSLALLGVGA